MTPAKKIIPLCIYRDQQQDDSVTLFSFLERNLLGHMVEVWVLGAVSYNIPIAKLTKFGLDSWTRWLGENWLNKCMGSQLTMSLQWGSNAPFMANPICQQVKGSDPSAPLSTAEATCGVQHPDQVSSAWESCKHTGASPARSQQKLLRDWSICPMKRGWKNWVCSAWRGPSGSF